jgi:uncharacterized SAM-binding protein YcdF (DUF218 family)
VDVEPGDLGERPGAGRSARRDRRPRRGAVRRARLDHAIALYRDGVAPVVVVTGSNQPGDRVTEASASAEYLHRNGIADEVIRREVRSRNTYDQIAAARVILRREGIEKVVLVSDPLHSHRLALTARETGLDAEVSPRTVRVAAGPERARTLLRETIAVSAGRIVGFRRLRNLQGELRAGDAPLPSWLAAGPGSGAG